MAGAVDAAVQVALGLAVVYVVYRVSLWMTAQDALVASSLAVAAPVARQRVLVLDGYALGETLAGRSWSTSDPTSRHYAPLRRSYNRQGGAQFTYSFWLLLGDTSVANLRDRTLLLRGDPEQGSYEYHEGGVAVPGGRVTESMLIKCPRIAFGANGLSSVVVEFNTLHRVREAVTFGSANSLKDPTSHKNLLPLTANAWTLYTFTFEDRVAINEFENGILVRMYVNDALYRSRSVSSTLRQNEGNLHLFPKPAATDQAEVKQARMGDVVYHNYAVSAEDVRRAFARGPPKHMAKDGRGSRGEPLHLSEFNKVDIYNHSHTPT
jgi:hypothetical protein